MCSLQSFGGRWTEEKLDRLRKYLSAYMTIFRSNPRAQHFQTIYVDAFAGSGYRVEQSLSVEHDVGSGPMFQELIEDREVTSFFEGSAQIALGLDKPFSKYLFIEQDPDYARELQRLAGQPEYSARQIDIVSSDANPFLQQWCRSTDWRKHRSVVFLDPYGMQVHWDTIRSLGETKAVDLWLLFPLGQAVNRLLTKSGPPVGAWADRLTDLFGTDDWRTEFYRESRQSDMFGSEPQLTKDASWQAIESFFLNRLSMHFAKVAKPRRLLNSKGIPIFLLCFAAANPKGATTAVKIADDILGS